MPNLSTVTFCSQVMKHVVVSQWAELQLGRKYISDKIKSFNCVKKCHKKSQIYHWDEPSVMVRNCLEVCNRRFQGTAVCNPSHESIMFIHQWQANKKESSGGSERQSHTYVKSPLKLIISPSQSFRSWHQHYDTQAQRRLDNVVRPEKSI